MKQFFDLCNCRFTYGRILPFTSLAFRLNVDAKDTSFVCYNNGKHQKRLGYVFLQKEVVESIGNPAGIGQGTGLGLRDRDRDGIGLGHYRLRARADASFQSNFCGVL